jgi:LPS-assembly protein
LFRPKEFWHFHFTPSIGFRATHYGDSIEPNQGSANSLVTNHGPVTRLLAEVGLDLRPPSLEKVFTNSYRGYRLKHVIEPDIQYRYVRAHDPENIQDIVRFDALDIFTETNEVEYSLTNTILARKDVPDNSPDTPQARDIFSWRLSQKYYFDPTFGGALVPGQINVFASTIDLTGFSFAHGQRFSPIDSVFKFAPFSNFDTEIQTDMNPSGSSGVVDAGITSRIRRGVLGIAVRDFFINNSSYLANPSESSSSGSPSTSLQPLTAFNLLGALATYGDPNRRGLSGAFGMDYNFQQKIFQHAVGQVSYNFGCFGIDIEYQYFNLGPLRRENQIRVALSLANVGTFGNLKPRERLY